MAIIILDLNEKGVSDSNFSIYSRSVKQSQLPMGISTEFPKFLQFTVKLLFHIPVPIYLYEVFNLLKEIHVLRLELYKEKRALFFTLKDLNSNISGRVFVAAYGAH